MGLGFFTKNKRTKKSNARTPAAAPAVPVVTAAPTPAASPAPAASRLPRFKATATDQLDRRRSDRFLSVRMKLRNAFPPSQPVAEGEMLAGRQELMAQMISAIEDRRLHLVLYGERGIGKTSLLHVLAEVARTARYIVIYSSCGAGSDFQETFRAAAGEIPLMYHSSFGPTSEEAEAGATMADLLPETFSPRQFADVCARLTGTRVLVFIDEFERAQSAGFRRDVAELIKFLSDRAVRMQLVIGGVAGDLSELTEYIPSIRRNVFPVRVPQMSEDEIRDLVANGARACGLTFDADATDLIVKISRGWPYIAVLLCNHAGLCALDAERDLVLAEDVSSALSSSGGELRARMSKATTQQVDAVLGQEGGRALTLIAAAALSAPGEFGSHDIDAEAAPAAEIAAAKRLLEQLAAARILVEKRGDGGAVRYGFIDEGVPPYVWFAGSPQDLLAPPPRARAKAG